MQLNKLIIKKLGLYTAEEHEAICQEMGKALEHEVHLRMQVEALLMKSLKTNEQLRETLQKVMSQIREVL